LCGKLFGDKGCISEKLNKQLARQELFLITKMKKNMKNKLMLLNDKMWLKCRGVIESVIDLLKHICDIEHSRHRSPVNALVNLMGGLSAYSFLDHKPWVKSKSKRFRVYLTFNNIPMVA
jgi:hypothetical protein